jgi:hypothetical protein
MCLVNADDSDWFIVSDYRSKEVRFGVDEAFSCGIDRIGGGIPTIGMSGPPEGRGRLDALVRCILQHHFL